MWFYFGGRIHFGERGLFYTAVLITAVVSVPTNQRLIQMWEWRLMGQSLVQLPCELWVLCDHSTCVHLEGSQRDVDDVSTKG